MLRRVTPHVYCWSEIHGEARNEPYPWNSYLIDVPNDDVVVLIDPLPISSDGAQEIEGNSDSDTHSSDMRISSTRIRTSQAALGMRNLGE